ncbi:UDP-N-acetyl-D-mannosaminouronate:lipid I N-acetyl-D-mannosaminouronosyltransferase [Gelidibacter sediminis]|uniref:UDP-N-acetyl-D-mannosaminouronate:lipid I N-acetyl-D-mannosaminouronosyltransferase n=1 Tax=Gelidibacter sediminis TaxID=1608710 RepID=A0A4R7Q826_9FLAO|nr:WecB/TagA/CpsF family glycosyltransferase [Gelidibacter sediminis]TDU42880.1 UDP-N-acetyl-D-mannosaminouronate:lipid I N-acetyl-D-mannosaminouronosyltransferase [Gelidibacter sediminis]
MEAKSLNGVITYAPCSRKELMQYAFDHHKIMVAVNAEKILHATDESRALINRNLGYPDGIGAVWALQQKGADNVVKIPGCELWLDVVQNYHKTKSFYLIGGKQEVIEATVSKLRAEFKGINICNYRDGYIKTEAEELALIEDIKKYKPDVVFVAMGSPKQELLMERIQKEHEAVYQGLGGSFDVYTGNVKRAPEWWVKNNMEWTYRLLSQPSRIKRQIHLVRFLVNLKLNKY